MSMFVDAPAGAPVMSVPVDDAGAVLAIAAGGAGGGGFAGGFEEPPHAARKRTAEAVPTAFDFILRFYSLCRSRAKPRAFLISLKRGPGSTLDPFASVT